MRRGRMALMLALAVSAAFAQADWENVNFAGSELTSSASEENRVTGPGKAYVCPRPDEGLWEVSFGLSNHFANLRDEQIRVYSANTVTFQEYNTSSGHAGRSSHVCFKFELSEPVAAAIWDLPSHGRHVSPGTHFSARYSTDGAAWRNAHVYAPGPAAEVDPPRVTLTFDPPAQEVYVGWFAEVPEGQTGYWNLGSTGTLTFLRPGETPQLETERAAQPDEPCAALHGERVIPNTFFGTTTHVNSENAIHLMNDLDMRTVRIDFPYVGLEPAPGQYNFDPELWIIRSADLGLEHGLDQLVVVTNPPPWSQLENGTFPSDMHAGAFEEFMFQLASKYKGKITHWQAMNEPNMALWKERFIVFLKAFHKGVKRADPANKVVLCGLAGDAPAQLDTIYRLGGKEYFDILGAHPYTRPALPESGGYLHKIQALHDVMTKYSDDKPLWVTEMGWNGVEASMLAYLRDKYQGHRAYACTEEDQARGLARLYLISATIPWIERVYFFHLHQESPYTEVMEQVDFYMGLFTPWLEGNVRPKDAYFAVKQVIRVLNEATFKERFETVEQVWALAFTRGDEATVALWSLQDGVTIALEDTSMIRDVTSMVGTPVLVDAGRLPLSGRPIYVRTSLSNLPRLKAQLQAAPLEGCPVLELALSVDLERTLADRPVLAVEVANTGNHPHPIPPIFLSASPTSWTMDTVQIEDKEPLPAGASRKHLVNLSSQDARGAEVALDVEARLFDGGLQSKGASTLRYASAIPRPEAFVADGDLGEWPENGAITIGHAEEQRELAGWAGLEDCSGRWWCGCDADALYFVAAIRDDMHQHPTDTAPDEMWRADSIQLGLDVAADAVSVANVPQYDALNDYELGFATTKEGPRVYVWINPTRQSQPLTLENCAIVRDEAAKETRYEVAIPWRELGLDNAPSGRWLGMNVLVNDNDGNARKGWLQWAPGLGYVKDPSRFPKVLLPTLTSCQAERA